LKSQRDEAERLRVRALTTSTPVATMIHTPVSTTAHTPVSIERKAGITSEVLDQIHSYQKILHTEMQQIKQLKSGHYSQGPVSKSITELKNSISRGAGAYSNETRTLVTKEVVGFTAITQGVYLLLKTDEFIIIYL